jgi:hypothetical protein
VDTDSGATAAAHEHSDNPTQKPHLGFYVQIDLLLVERPVDVAQVMEHSALHAVPIGQEPALFAGR